MRTHTRKEARGARRRGELGRLALALTLAQLALVGSGCATPDKARGGGSEAVYVQAEAPEPAPEPAPEVVAVPYAQPLPGQMVPFEDASPSEDELEARSGEAVSLERAVELANRGATQGTPSPNGQPGEGFVRATKVYVFVPGAIYQVISAPLHGTLITFGEGEDIIDFIPGDDTNWLVETTVSGGGQRPGDAPLRQHLYVHPSQRGRHATLKVTTTRGHYNFYLESRKHHSMAEVSFKYPAHDAAVRKQRLVAERARRSGAARPVAFGAPGGSQAGGAAASLETAVSPERMVCDYELVYASRRQKRRPPAWAPERVCHDGRRTFIWFGPDAKSRGLRPALFVLADDRTATIPQLSARPGLYVVAGVVERAELMMGGQMQSGSRGERARGEVVGLELAEGAPR